MEQKNSAHGSYSLWQYLLLMWSLIKLVIDQGGHLIDHAIEALIGMSLGVKKKYNLFPPSKKLDGVN